MGKGSALALRCLVLVSVLVVDMRGWFAGYDAFHTVFPLVVEMLCIMAGTYQKDRIELIVDSGRGMFKASFAGY